MTKLNAAGSALVYSTYLGGSSYDIGLGIRTDAVGNAYLTGLTASPNFPTTGGTVQPNFQGREDAFVTKLNAAGSALVYSTYLGGSSYDEGFHITVDADGNAYVGGWTTSFNFPTVNPFQADRRGEGDGFVAKLNATGDALVYSTYLGGSGSGEEIVNGIAVDSAGEVYVAGPTPSPDFPTVNPLQATLRGTRDSFVAKLNATGDALVYSTYLGGSGRDRVRDLAVDPAGNAYVVGWTDSADFPTVNPFQAGYGGGRDYFVTKLDASGSALVYSTYLGGSGQEARSTLGVGPGSLWAVMEIAVDSAGNAYVAGTTSSADFPTANPMQPALGGGEDAFAVKFVDQQTVLVANFMNGNTDFFKSRVYLWNPSTSAGTVTVRVFTLPRTDGLAEELTNTPLNLGGLGAKSALNIRLEDILDLVPGITTPYETDNGNLTLEFTTGPANVQGAAQVFNNSLTLAFGTYPLQAVPSTSAGSPTVLVANFLNGNTDFFRSRIYLFNPSASDGTVSVRVYTLPRTGDPAEELTNGPHPLGTLAARSGLNLRLEDILDELLISRPYEDDAGNLILEFTIGAADVIGAAQVFNNSLTLAFGTYPLQIIQ